MGLAGERVLVTGATRGIGRLTVERLAVEGAQLVLVARDVKALDALAGATGGVAIPADLADSAQVDGLVARAEEAVGPLDVLVNNAGVEIHGSLATAAAADVRWLYEVNVLAPAELCRQVLPGMVARGAGHIVNVSSLAGVGAFPGLAAYSSSKAALTHLTAGLRADLRGTGVTTTVVEIGPSPTDMLTALDDPAVYAPTARSFRRAARLQVVPYVPPQAVADAIVEAIAQRRRHVRLPRRATPFAMLAEAPRRIVELLLVGIPKR